MTTNPDQPTPMAPEHILQRSPAPSTLYGSLNRGFRVLVLLEPLLVAGATTFVYVSYLFHLHPALPWLGVVMAFAPFPIRWLARDRRRLATSFDPAIVLLMLGALIGVIFSPQSDLSLGAFQCMLALCALYYSCINYPHLTVFIKTAFPISLLVLLIVFLFVYVQLDQPVDPNSMPCTYHGLALSLLIAGIILAAIALFGRPLSTKLVAGLLSLCLIIAILLLVNESLPRLVNFDTVEGRMPRWEHTVDMLRDSPLAGLGLGCWALAYHGSTLITHPTHAHNAYLELYSNTGVLGAIALAFFLVVGFKLALDIIRSPRDNPWYGFGVGVVLACIATLLVGIVESAPIGVPLVASDTYYYLISPVPWILAGLLVIAKKLAAKPAQNVR